MSISSDSNSGDLSSINETSENPLQRDSSQFSLFSFTSTSHTEHFTCSRHAKSSLSSMQHFYESRKLCDIVLIAGPNGKKIPAHRLVLSAASEYFSAMFTGHLRESEQQEVILNEIDSDILESIVLYCYSGSIDIKEDNVEALFVSSSLMQFTNIIEACAKFLANQLHPTNCLGIASFAEHQNCKRLLDKANAFTVKNFVQVVKEKEFFLLPVDQMIKLLSDDDLNVSSEEQVFRALKNWINHDFESRKHHIMNLLALIKLPLLDSAFFMDHVEPWLGPDDPCHRLIMETVKWHLLPARRQEMTNHRTTPRKATLKRLIAIGGTNREASTITIETYDPQTDAWSVTHNISGPRWQFGVAWLDNRLIVVGGRDGLKTLNSMECLDMDRKTWSNMRPMNAHRHGLAVAELDGAVYAIGGHDCWHYLNSAERYDADTNTWHNIASMMYQRCSAGVAVLEDKIYIVGGRDGSTFLNAVECYDPQTNRWTKCAPMVHRRGFVGVAAINGCLYAIGGIEDHKSPMGPTRHNSVERYNPRDDSWSLVASISSSRDSVAACAFGGRVIVAGGYDGGNYSNIVEEYDPVVNKWKPLDGLKVVRAGVCVLPIPTL